MARGGAVTKTRATSPIKVYKILQYDSKNRLYYSIYDHPTSDINKMGGRVRLKDYQKRCVRSEKTTYSTPCYNTCNNRTYVYGYHAVTCLNVGIRELSWYQRFWKPKYPLTIVQFTVPKNTLIFTGISDLTARQLINPKRIMVSERK